MATRLSSVSATLAITLLVAGLLAGCDDSDNKADRAAASGSSSASSSPTGSTTPSEVAGESSKAADSPPGQSQPGAALTAGPGEIVVTGDVEPGVEPGCVVLRGSSETYVLIGGDQQRLAAGGKMTVRGKAETGMMTTCMQGTPLKVLEIQAG